MPKMEKPQIIIVTVPPLNFRDRKSPTGAIGSALRDSTDRAPDADRGGALPSC